MFSLFVKRVWPVVIFGLFFIGINFINRELSGSLDEYAHTIGGMVCGFFFYTFWRTFSLDTRAWILCLSALGSTALMGIAWECLELYLQSVTHDVWLPSIEDTLFDLVLDLAGALGMVGLLAIIKRSRRNK